MMLAWHLFFLLGNRCFLPSLPQSLNFIWPVVNEFLNFEPHFKIFGFDDVHSKHLVYVLQQ
jgi:hypothetical protein